MRSERYGWRFILVLVLAWTVLLYLFLPIFIAAPLSLTPDRYLLMPTGEFSFRHYENLFTNPKWLSSIWQSLVIAVSATIIAVVTGSLAAVGIWRLASRFGETLRAFILLPMIVPSIVSGLVFFRIFVDLGLLDSLPGVILAHSILAAPYVVITVSTSLAGFDLKFVAPKNAFVTPEPMAVLAGARNPKAARAFIEFLLTERGQKVFMERGLFPITPKYKVQGAPGSTAELAVQFTGGVRSYFDGEISNVYDESVAAKRSEALKTRFRSDIEAVWKKPN